MCNIYLRNCKIKYTKTQNTHHIPVVYTEAYFATHKKSRNKTKNEWHNKCYSQTLFEEIAEQT